MHVEYAQLPPPEDSADCIFITHNAVIVLDGATAFVPIPISGQAYADHLGHALVKELTAHPDIDLSDAVAGAIRQTTHSLGLSRGASPSSTVSIVRAAPSGYDVFVLGDSPVIWGNNQHSWTLCDDRLDQLRLPQQEEYRAQLRAGHGFDHQHRMRLRALQTAQARRRNTEGGYWIAEADPLAAYNARVTTVPSADANWAILTTDGASDVLKHRGRDRWQEIARLDGDQLTRLLAHLHQWERNCDPAGKHLPRSKIHDDKTLAVILSPSA